MADITLTRPQVILKDDQGTTLSSWDYEFQAIVEAEELASGTYTVERPTLTIVVTA